MHFAIHTQKGRKWDFQCISFGVLYDFVIFLIDSRLYNSKKFVLFFGFMVLKTIWHKITFLTQKSVFRTMCIFFESNFCVKPGAKAHHFEYHQPYKQNKFFLSYKGACHPKKDDKIVRHSKGNALKVPNIFQYVYVAKMHVYPLPYLPWPPRT